MYKEIDTKKDDGSFYLALEIDLSCSWKEKIGMYAF